MRMRVLHVVPNLIPDGLERIVSTLALRTDRSRFEVSVVSLYSEQPGSLAATLAAAGIPVFHLDKRRGFDARMFGRFYRLVSELRPDVVHTHNYVLRYTLPATLMQRTPVQVHTIHNVADREVDRLGMWIQWLAFRGPVAPVVIAQAAARSFERVYGASRPPLIMNGIDVDRYANAILNREVWRRCESFNRDDLLFVCAARFFAQKDHASLLRAFAAGPGRLPQCHLVLAGDGPLRSELERLTNELGIAGKVRFLGRREDIPGLLGASDIFVMASRWEGNPLAVMEAMSAGLPCAVTAAGGVPELVKSETHGIVTPPGEVSALAEAMMRLAQDVQLRRRMGGEAKDYARKTFDAIHMVEAYESLYEQLRPFAITGGADACAVR